MRAVLLLLLCSFLALSGCDEPRDCGNGPGRCLAAQGGQTQPPVPAQRARPSIPPLRDEQGARPTPVAKPAETAAPQQPPTRPPQRRIAPVGGVPAAAIGGAPTADFERQAQVVFQSRKTPEALIRRIVNVGANHNASGLKRFCTAKLSANIDKMLSSHSERFWRHIDKYVTAASEGFEIEEAAGPTKTSKQLTVKARGGIVLRPVVAQDEKGWLFARF